MNWRNIPIPETVVIPLLVAGILEAFIPLTLISTPFLGIPGIVLLVCGILLILWSVREVGVMEISMPDALITSGPYSHSRNPMYLGWLAIALAIVLLKSSPWTLIGFLIAFLGTHFLAVIPEEQRLLATFGESYAEYCREVRRYL